MNKYETGQCYEVICKPEKGRFAQKTYKATIRLGKKIGVPQTNQRFEIQILKGRWPYRSIRVNNLNGYATKRLKGAEVLYGPNDCVKKK